jgi:DNA-binding response OmpR family regulator
MANILIVEDDPRTGATVAALLRCRGYDTRVETNGAAALLAAHEDMPDLILMDLVMPILDGHEAIEALRHNQNTAHIPIIVISGHDDDRTMADALVAGANVFLTKPLDPAELVTMVGRLLALQPKTPPAP